MPASMPVAVAPAQVEAEVEAEADDSPGARAPTAPLGVGWRPATVEQLLASFVPSDGLTEREISRNLKQSVGIELSALPPGVETLAPPAVVASEPWQPAPEVAPVMTPPLPSIDPQPPRRPRSAMAVTVVLMLLGLAATLAIWAKAPGFFTGHLP
jgi:hypothetical protein